jgi:hypothetical protein
MWCKTFIPGNVKCVLPWLAGWLAGLKIALVGDLKHGRTVHSLAKVRNPAISAMPFYAKNDQFTKTGSGQTWGKLSKEEWRFLISIDALAV